METKIPAIAVTDTKVLVIENAAEGASAPGCSGAAPPGLDAGLFGPAGAGGEEVFGLGDEGEGAGEEFVEGEIAGEGVGDFVDGAELGDNDCVGAGADRRRSYGTKTHRSFGTKTPPSLPPLKHNLLSSADESSPLLSFSSTEESFRRFSGNKEELLLLVLEKVTSHIFTRLVLNYSACVVIEIFAHTLQEKHVKLFLYQDGSVLDSDMFDMWGDKDEEKKVKKVHIIALHILFMLKMLL
ncbi:hypothetical protein P8452_74983 [Trifolium repens]|nr:hypothetical protein P8452_74983 [Trifolium repens]